MKRLINIVAEEKLIKQAKEKAKKEGRTLSGQIRYLLEQFINNKL